MFIFLIQGIPEGEGEEPDDPQVPPGPPPPGTALPGAGADGLEPPLTPDEEIEENTDELSIQPPGKDKL